MKWKIRRGAFGHQSKVLYIGKRCVGQVYYSVITKDERDVPYTAKSFLGDFIKHKRFSTENEAMKHLEKTTTELVEELRGMEGK